MEPSARVLIFFSAIFIVCISLTNAAKSANSTVGVCELEVPVISILPPELKHTAGSTRGNGTNPSLAKIKICCSGYKVGPHSPFHCLPDCPNECGIGNCTAPNVCSCYKGATLGPDGKCTNVCPKGCLNGQCYNNFCNCNMGFILESTGKYCVPGCTRNCGPGGVCVGNNQCNCSVGFHLNLQGVCATYCEKGYQQVGNVCEPKCSRGCQNGVCTAPERCTCNPGWTMGPTGSICKPNCSNPCLNGECTAPNVCTCKPGYIKDPSDARGSRCVAHCPGGCPNGICSAPNFCICNYGYVKQSRGSNTCVKK